MMRSPRSLRFLPPLTGALILTAALAQSDLRARLLLLLPDNGQSAEIMRWETDPMYNAIQDRIRQAMSLDPRWFREYAALHRNTDRLPYHEKFGVSESEYQRYQADDWLHLERTGRTARLLISKTGNKVTFHGGSGAEALRGITLDTVSGELSIPEGMSAKPRPVSVAAQDDRIGLGARKGWGWSIEGVNLKTRTAVVAKFHLMQLSSGAVLLAYNRGTLVDSKRQPTVDLTLIYDKKLGVSRR